ncbi:DUF3375 domain-containing protein [Pseudoclavibacter helvolus]|uniref:DUF3375 domain-containing protein n=1 Tax=Pseudoclavibacter helvolus TaxID=255205 RepID=UPI000838FFC4|nr:DUF3375 domain-containing protein [Pseudoclavibacter helvolus]
MSALASALAYQRLVTNDVTLQLLRANTAPIIAAVLRTHLGSPGARIKAEELYELIDSDLEDLRDHFDMGDRNGKSYCADWRAAGYLIRRPDPESRGETFELSPAAFNALRILEQIERPRSTATESRLMSLAAQLHQLAVDTDPDSTRRLATLRQERDSLDDQIDRIERGEHVTLDANRAAERVQDIVQQAENLPADFSQVRSRFEELNRRLRAEILASEDSRRRVLDDIFRGVDVIESSDEGRTFTAFSDLVLDPENSATLDADIAEILRRDFTADLDDPARALLNTLVRDLKRGSRDVHGVLTDFARGLRRYVRSQEFQRDRVLRASITQALSAATEAARTVKPFTPTSHSVTLTSSRIGSIGALVLHNPSDYDIGDPLQEYEPEPIDLEVLRQLARETEVDFDELERNIAAVLTTRQAATVREVLDAYPASQGVASVVGLLTLAVRDGQVDAAATERVTWTSADGQSRQAIVVTHTFTATQDGVPR